MKRSDLQRALRVIAPGVALAALLALPWAANALAQPPARPPVGGSASDGAAVMQDNRPTAAPTDATTPRPVFAPLPGGSAPRVPLPSDAATAIDDHPADDANATPASSADDRDPFSTTATMAEESARLQPTIPGGAAGPMQLPPLRLLGIAKGANEIVALLRVGEAGPTGQTIVIRPGDALNLNIGGYPLVIKVDAIDAQGATILAGPYAEPFNVR